MCFMLLLGSDVNWMDEENNALSSLHLASLKGHTEVVRILIQAGGNVNVQDM